MLRDERRQWGIDRHLVPELVGRYVCHAPRRDALRTARQVNTVTHYLSKMATGEARLYEGAYYGTTIVCLDEVTDELGETLSNGTTGLAFEDEVRLGPLEILPVAADVARSDDFPEAVRHIAYWQDRSLEQLEDPNPLRVKEITRKKGGYSALANLLMVKEDPSEEERDFMMEFGYVMQLLDDYLDQPEDEKEGVSTMFTEDVFNTADLFYRRDAMMERAEELWGRTKASRRFRRVLAAHTGLAEIENRTRFSTSTFVPWYL